MSSSKNLEKEYDLLSEKIHHLRMALAIETDAAVKFKLEKQIEEAEAERTRIEQQLEGAEKLSITCPYRGLFAFREQDAEFFFGREAYTEQLAEAVQNKPFVAVIGASGSGKSSVVYAGLLPELRRQGNWLIASFRPGENPFQALSKVLIPFLYTDELDRISKVKQLTEQLHNGEIAVSDVVERILEKNGKAEKFLLFADQFEELYTLCREDDLRHQFVDVLLQPSEVSKTSEISLILTMRVDFLSKALSYRPFADILQHASMMLGPMNREELRATIERPAKMLDVDIEEGLTDRTLDAVSNEPGNLPLLEFALTELWERQHGGMLPHAAYDEIGGVECALTSYAESVYENLSVTEKERARHIFVQLVRPGEGTEDIRRIAHYADVGEENRELVSKLADARLVVTGGSEDRSANFNLPEETVEVVHEAMIRGWQRLREWVEADREFRTWQERLRFATSQWTAGDHDEGALLRGAPLAEAEQWLEQRQNDLNQEEQHFIETSVQLRNREVKARKKLRQRITIGLVAGLVIAIALAVFSGIQWKKADTQRQIADKKTLEALKQKQIADEQKQQADEARQKAEINAIEALNQTSKALFLAHDELGALLAAVKAGKKTKQKGIPAALKNQTIYNLRELVYGVHERNQIKGVSVSGNLTFSPDGTLLALGSWDGTILCKVSDGSVITTLDSPAVSGVAFSPDGTLLASGKLDNGVIGLWDIKEGREVRTLEGHSEWVSSIWFSPDGTMIAPGSEDGTLKLWNIANGREISTLQGHPGWVLSIGFSPDGPIIASGSEDGTIKLWNASNGGEISTLQGRPTGVFSVAFSPDGTLLASGSRDNTIKLWNVSNGKEITTLQGHSAWVSSVAFSPDGTLLASSDSTTIKLWNVAVGERLLRHPDRVIACDFSSDGTLLAVGGWDHKITLWNVVNGREITTLKGHSNIVGRVKFSPDGTVLASKSSDGTIKLWNIVDGREIITLNHGPPSIWPIESDIAFSSNSKLFVYEISDHTIKLWDLNKNREITSLEGYADFFISVFSPDMTMIASGSGDGTIKLRNISDGEEIITLYGHSARIRKIKFNLDGTLLASKSEDNTIKVWKIAEVGEMTTLQGTDFAFHPDNTNLAFVSMDGKIKLWNVSDGSESTILSSYGNSISDIRFSPNGKLLALDIGQEIQIWNIFNHESITFQGSWVRFSPDGKMLALKLDANTIQLWKVADLGHLNLGDLLVRGCEWLHGYLKNNPNISEEDRALCDDILE